MKCHTGVGSNSGLEHAVVSMPGSEADVSHAHRLLHDQEKHALSDSQGVDKRMQTTNSQVSCHITVRKAYARSSR